MSFCPKDGKCQYNDRIRCDTDFCVWPRCPFVADPVKDMSVVEYRRHLSIIVADLTEKPRRTATEEIQLTKAKKALKDSLQMIGRPPGGDKK